MTYGLPTLIVLLPLLLLVTGALVAIIMLVIAAFRGSGPARMALAVVLGAFVLVPVAVLVLGLLVAAASRVSSEASAGATAPRLVLMWPAVILLSLLLGLCIAGIVKLIRSGKGAWIAVLLACLLLPAGFFAMTFAARVQVAPRSPAPVIASTVPPASPAWLAADEVFLEADVYPSAETATRRATARAIMKLTQVTGDESKPQVIAVYGQQTPPLRDVAAATLAAAEPSLRVVRSDPGVSVIGAKVYLTANIPAAGEGVRSVQVTLAGPAGEVIETAAFTDKPWVENFSQYISNNASRPLYLAQSARPALTADEALQLAYEDAADHLATVLRVRATEIVLSRRAELDVERLNEPYLRPIVLAELDKGGFVADRFVQRFQRPSGHVYRALLLIERDPQQIEAIAGSYVATLKDRRHGMLATLGSLAALLATILVLYLFLNAATRGYYTAALRTACLVLGLAVVLGAVVMFA